MVKKPNFLCIGAQKAGTSSLHVILRNHPQIYLPEVKETHFFDWDEKYQNGLDWYLEQFYADVGNERAIGEITPNYMYDKNAPERICNHLGKAVKLIFILRNPADRAYSQYLMHKSKRSEKNSYAESVRIGVELLRTGKDYPLNTNHPFHYLNRGFYDAQINMLLKFFKKENMLFFLFESDFIDNRRGMIEKICDFLDVDKLELDLDVKANASAVLRSEKADYLLNTANPVNQFAKSLLPSKGLRTKMKARLGAMNLRSLLNKEDRETQQEFLINNVYKESILKLEHIIERDLSCWYKK